MPIQPIIERATSQAPPEARQDYTDVVTAALVSAATGNAPGNPQALAALEVCAGAYARAFAMATIAPDGPVMAGFSVPVMMMIARQLIRVGESVWIFDVRNGRGFLTPCATWDIHGKTADRSGWLYRVDVATPSGNVTKQVSGQSILHFQYAVDPARPWRGIAPLRYASVTGKLASLLETKLGQESAGPVATLIPLPQDGNQNPTLTKDIESAKGDALTVRTTQSGWGEGGAGRPQTDWMPRRLGANPPQGLVSLRSDVAAIVVAACGVPTTLLTGAEGAAERESWRRFLHGSVQPLGDLVATEISLKLEEPGTKLSFDKLFASDIMGRARAFQSMVSADMDVTKAAALSGLMSAE